MMERGEDEDDIADTDATFRLSDADLAIFKRLAAELRPQLTKVEPRIIRSAAPAILALERLPRPTAGVQVRFGYQTPNRDGNYGWADISLSENDIEGTVGEHFYDPGVGGDTESSALFYREVGGSSDYGSLKEWWERFEGLGSVGYLSVEDDSDWDAIDWNAE
jgi:hypothetical protein